MPHVCLVAMTGFRVADPALRELGLKLPGLQARGKGPQPVDLVITHVSTPSRI